MVWGCVIKINPKFAVLYTLYILILKVTQERNLSFPVRCILKQITIIKGTTWEKVTMPNKLITLDKAIKEVERLKTYIELIEEYETDTLEKWVIKQYALTNSIKKIIEIAEVEGMTNSDLPLDRKYISGVINGKVMDELHRVLRQGYRQKIKPNKRNYNIYK